MSDQSRPSRSSLLSRRRSLRIFASTALACGTAGHGALAFAGRRRRRHKPKPKPQVCREQCLQDLNADMATRWFQIILTLIKVTPGYTPPVASRSLAYISCALYEAAHRGMPGFRSLSQVLPSFPKLRKPRSSDIHYGVAANAALAEAAGLFFPKTTDAMWKCIARLKKRFDDEFRACAGAKFAESERHGQIIAQQIYVHSLSDGGDAAYDDNFPSSYVPPTGRGLWVPTDPQGSLQPYWGENRAFVLPQNDIFDPGPHIPEFDDVPGSGFYNLAKEVQEAVDQITPEQEAIALFWSDDPVITATPPGHSFSIATQVLKAQGRNLQDAIEVYVKLGIAQADAFISCWESKYRYNVIRPITYIREHIPGGENWTPILPTPPFPEYTSGHSVQSGAMAEVLGELLGRNYAFTDYTHENRGLGTRSFASFDAAADEAAISRLYGGVHYTPAIDLGVAQGKKIGRLVNQLRFR